MPFKREEKVVYKEIQQKEDIKGKVKFFLYITVLVTFTSGVTACLTNTARGFILAHSLGERSNVAGKAVVAAT